MRAALTGLTYARQTSPQQGRLLRGCPDTHQQQVPLCSLYSRPDSGRKSLRRPPSWKNNFERILMRLLVFAWVLDLLFVPAFGDTLPDSRWANGMDLAFAFPDPSPDFPPEDDSVVKHVPGSTKSYAQGQLDDLYNPPDL